MKKKFYYIIIAIAVIIAGSIFAIFNPTYLSLKFYGTEVSSNISTNEANTIYFSGIKYNYGNDFLLKMFDLNLPNTNLTLPISSGFITYPLTNSYEFCYGAFINEDIGSNGVWERFELYLSVDSDWCVIATDKDRLFVGSIHEDFNAAEILEIVSDHLN